jgi:hypothetical protein
MTQNNHLTDYDYSVTISAKSLEPCTRDLCDTFHEAVSSLVNEGALTRDDISNIMYEVEAFEELRLITRNKNGKKRILYDKFIEVLNKHPHLQGVEHNAFFDLRSKFVLQKSKESDSHTLIEKIKALITNTF